MKRFFTVLFSTAVFAGAVSLTSCVQKDVAEAPEYSKRTVVVEGVLLVNDDIFVPANEQTWNAPQEAVEIEFTIPNDNLSDIGASNTIVRTTCDTSTGKYKVALPIGAMGAANITITVKDFRGTLTREDQDDPGEEETVDVIWHGVSSTINVQPNDTRYDIFYFDGNNPADYTVVRGAGPGEPV